MKRKQKTSRVMVKPSLPEGLVALLETVRSKDYFECLGIGPDASTTQVHEAYRKRVAELDNLRVMSGLHQGMKEAVDEVAHVLDDALDVLSDPDIRLAYRRAISRG